MAKQLHVYLLPRLVPTGALHGSSVVVIDVLRASTTMTWALAAGAHDVIPCLEVTNALDRATRLDRASYLLGGEREGLKIDGFDLGNSPSEYSEGRVAGKSIIFTTTNGTQALLQCREAKSVFIGAFVNLSAVVAQLGEEDSISLLCAGTRGEITREDVLLAGCLADRLLASSKMGDSFSLNDQALIAIDAWRAIGFDFASAHSVIDQLAEQLKNTQGGRNLQRIGLAADIGDAADIDRFAIVPRLDLADWTIRLGRG